jgi:hypothetical protein
LAGPAVCNVKRSALFVVLAATAGILAGVLGLLAGLLATALLAWPLLAAALLMLAALLATLLVLAALAGMLRILRILVHLRSPGCPAPIPIPTTYKTKSSIYLNIEGT